MKAWKWALGLSVAVVLIGLFVIGCSNGSGSAPKSNLGTVNVSLSDPATCSGTSLGEIASIYVTITDVSIHTNPDAAMNDSAWQDLTPSLSSAPVQVDLLHVPTNGCFLAMLGSVGIPAGTYQQMRLRLATTGATGNTNPCGSGVANCVVVGTAPNQAIYPLRLASEAQTGIKLPSGQMAGGKFTIAAGETKDLNIDFNGCASILKQMGNGDYILKPVLHAGEVSTTQSAAITGKLVLVDGSGKPVTIGKAFAVIEQVEDGVDRVKAEVKADSTGQFIICPVPLGVPFDLVAVGFDANNNVYGPTLVTGITAGSNIGDVTVNLAGSGTSGPPATLAGKFNIAPGTTHVAVVISALQTPSGSSTPITIPAALTGDTPVSVFSVTTPSGSAPFSGTYSLTVPGATFTVGSFSGGKITWGAAPQFSAAYTVEARTFTTLGASICSPNKLTDPVSTPVTPNANVSVTPDFAFTGCQ